MINIEEAINPHQIDLVRDIFLKYGISRGFDAALGDYQKELDALPAPYHQPIGALLLAFWENELAGCIAFKRLTPEICEMKRLYVLDEFRGKGLGDVLIEKLLQLAIERGYKIMRLDTHPHMHAAQKLYAAHGFYEIDRYNDNPTPGIRFFEKMLRDKKNN